MNSNVSCRGLFANKRATWNTNKNLKKSLQPISLTIVNSHSIIINRVGYCHRSKQAAWTATKSAPAARLSARDLGPNTAAAAVNLYRYSQDSKEESDEKLTFAIVLALIIPLSSLALAAQQDPSKKKVCQQQQAQMKTQQKQRKEENRERKYDASLSLNRGTLLSSQDSVIYTRYSYFQSDH